MTEIHKKINPEYFEKILSGEKTFEFRVADFECHPGDILVLEEWEYLDGIGSTVNRRPTGRVIRKRVGYVGYTRDFTWLTERPDVAADYAKYGAQIISLLDESEITVETDSENITPKLGDGQMKALLTSGGIANPTIEAEMWRLLGGRREGIRLLFITTASNWDGGKMNDWLIPDLVKFQELGFEIDICDFAGVPKEKWLPRFEWAEVYFFEGGNTGWLRRQIKDCGLEEELPRLLEGRVWIGCSAGSIVLCPTICNSVQSLYGEDDFTPAGTTLGLNYVDFDFVPHLNSAWVPNVCPENVRKAAEELEQTGSRKLYACDDNSAVSVDGDQVKVVSEGEVVEIKLAANK